jgi:hypothetical protein
MTEIRVRHEIEAKGLYLADVPFDQINHIIPTLKSWGITDYENRELSGSFVVEESAAFFEVVIHTDEEGQP